MFQSQNSNAVREQRGNFGEVELNFDFELLEIFLTFCEIDF